VALFADLTEDDFAGIHAPIDDLFYRAQSTVFREGDRAVGVFTLRSGMIKLVRTTGDGRARIVRVLRQGDAMGLEALATGCYDHHAIALLDTTVCRIPLGVIHALSQNSKNLHKPLMHKWHHALRQADDWLADLNFGSARQRVANLALQMRDPNNATRVQLFSREDMGAILNLQQETVSRELRTLVREGVLRQCDSQSRIFDIQLLQALQHAGSGA
jgi:CRP-like cAMP-binding protein